MDPTISVTEEELHAWLDGELSPERMDAVEAHLAARPEDSARLEAYRADGEALVRLFGDASGHELRAPMPRLAAADRAASRRVVAFTGWRRAAAIALIFGAGAAAGWLGRERVPTAVDDLARFAEEAAVTHTIMASGSQPLPVASIPPKELQAALAAALGVPVKLPEVERIGYRLVNGAFIPTPTGRATQLIFRDETGSTDSEIAVYIQPKPDAEETPFRRFDAGGLTIMAWEAENIVCAISGSVPVERLERIGRLMYEALQS
jgi:anti-sigma factor RsiW